MTQFTGIAFVDRLLAGTKPSPNRHGNAARQVFYSSSRYIFDTGLGMTQWRQFTTESDAWYFGIWADKEDLRILTYAEGDIIFTQCTDTESFDAELAYMCEFHAPAPSFTTVDENTVTRYYEDRREHFVEPERCPPSSIQFDKEA